jgi:hypothetical protein
MVKKWRAFGAYCGFHRVNGLRFEFLFLAVLGLCLNEHLRFIFEPKNDRRVSF